MPPVAIVVAAIGALGVFLIYVGAKWDDSPKP